MVDHTISIMDQLAIVPSVEHPFESRAKHRICQPCDLGVARGEVVARRRSFQVTEPATKIVLAQLCSITRDGFPMKPSSSGEVAPFLPGSGSLNCTAGNMDFPMDFPKLRRQSEARGWKLWECWTYIDTYRSSAQWIGSWENPPETDRKPWIHGFSMTSRGFCDRNSLQRIHWMICRSSTKATTEFVIWCSGLYCALII